LRSSTADETLLWSDATESRLRGRKVDPSVVRDYLKFYPFYFSVVPTNRCYFSEQGFFRVMHECLWSLGKEY